MKNNIHIIVGITILFLGLAIQPSVAVQQDSEDDCNLCPKKVSKTYIILLKSLINRLDRYDNQLLVLSKYNPLIEKKYMQISNNIKTLKEMSNNNEWDLPIFCGIMESIFWFNWNYFLSPMIRIGLFLDEIDEAFLAIWVFIFAIPLLISIFLTNFFLAFIYCPGIPDGYPPLI